MLAKRAWLVLFPVVCVVFFYGLGAVPLLGPDEPRYAEVAREMFARGDWVTPTLGGHVWFEKPALAYWLMMAAYRLFGVTEFAARAGSALAGVATVLTVGWVARRAESESGESLRGFGFTCAVLAASTLGLLAFARAASFDVILTATVGASLACFYGAEVERDDRRRRLYLVGFYAFIGTSLLAKGLVGVVIPAGVVLLYYLLRREWPRPLRLGVVWGVPLALAVAGVWYAPVIARNGWPFVQQFFIEHHFARYVSDKYHHEQPFYFFVPVILALALPWTLFLVGEIFRLRETRARADDATNKLIVLALAWMAFPVLFFSASESKLPGYVLPALPGALLLAGNRVHGYLRGVGGQLTMRLTGALALLFSLAGVGFIFFGLRPLGDSLRQTPLACTSALLLPSALAGVVAVFFAGRRALCFLSVACATLLTVPIIVVCALEPAARGETMGRAFALADKSGLGKLPVVCLHEIERTAEFYASGRLAYDAGGDPLKLEGAGEVADFLKRHEGTALVLVPIVDESQLRDDAELESRRVGDNGRIALELVKLRGP
jgi:4-amino-4-deoxy-L-arabinose transferase-like glycosyltransferase